jgi:hypothetical protein
MLMSFPAWLGFNELGLPPGRTEEIETKNAGVRHKGGTAKPSGNRAAARSSPRAALYFDSIDSNFHQIRRAHRMEPLEG